MDPFYSQLIVVATLIMIVALFTVITFDTWQTTLLVILFLIGVNYLILLTLDRLTTVQYGSIKEGFVTESSDASLSKYEWLSNDDLFDDFYASVFTKLTQNENLIQAETAICLEEFARNTTNDQLIVLDAGCGIGIASCALAKQGVGQVVGIDKSQAMIRYAKGTTLSGTTLTETERQNVEFRMFDLMGPGAAAAGEFTNVCILYFTIYYIKDLETFFRNLALWVKPGGSMAIEVVNKYKFDPVLDSSNPWVGISPQNYVKERLKTSKVVFDKFDYEATFELEDPTAEFRETFRFKDGSTRRQKHTLTMPSIADIIKKAQRSGWSYTKYVDLMPLSFQYGYLLFFTRTAE
jgi:SAM-dependent methyltransferase/general stress protein CsbA